MKKPSFSLLCILFVLLWCVFTVTNYQDYKAGGRWGPFKHDMFAYYAYLPAVFVYDWDLDFEYTKHIPENDPVVFLPTTAPNGAIINKVTIGMSAMMMPAFLVGHAWAKICESNSPEKATGFSIYYRIMMLVSSIGYVIWALFLLRRLLRRRFGEVVTGLTLIGTVLGTNVFFYTVHEHMMSHAYSFFLFAAFMYLTVQWYETQRRQTLLWLGFVSALIILVRPTNIVIALFFILHGIIKWTDFWTRMMLWARYPVQFGGAILVGLATVFPQLLYWKTKTGNWFFYSYASWERFFWEEPAIGDGLFSYVKGWYVYTPIMLLATIGIYFVWRFAKEWFWSVVVFYCLNTYIVLSWWSWWYGGGFGLRAFAEAAAPMSLGLASLLAWIWSQKPIARYSLLLPIVFCITLNLFQTMQYKRVYIIWNGMTKERYWKVFGKTKLSEEERQEIEKMVKEPERKGLKRD